MFSRLSGIVSSPPSQEFDAICASGWPPTPLRMAVSASNRACSPKKPLLQRVAADDELVRERRHVVGRSRRRAAPRCRTGRRRPIPGRARARRTGSATATGCGPPWRSPAGSGTCPGSGRSRPARSSRPCRCCAGCTRTPRGAGRRCSRRSTVGKLVVPNCLGSRRDVVLGVPLRAGERDRLARRARRRRRRRRGRAVRPRRRGVVQAGDPERRRRPPTRAARPARSLARSRYWPALTLAVDR